MNTKSVQQVLPPPPPHMVGDGFRVHNFFPSGYTIAQDRMSPFFMLDYNSKIEFPPRETPRGVGVHPHRGFETVSIAYHGRIAHHDSFGNSGVIGEGDVQWMTAGSGLLHKEYHDKEYAATGGPFQMVQLWVNLPAKFKMTTPKYQAILNNEMGRYILPEESGEIEVIAGSYQSVKGPASTFTPIFVYNVRLRKGKACTLHFPTHYNSGILIIEGGVIVNEENAAPADNFILFKNDGEEIRLLAEEDTIALVLSGEPIREPIVAYGPFLMNTKAEIMEAYNDMSQGKFGVLED